MGRFLCGLFGIACVCGGCLGLWHAFSNRTALETSCDAYLAQRPATLWVQLSGCELDYDQAEWIPNPDSAHHSSGQTLKAVYIPVHGSTDPVGPTVLVMRLGENAVKTIQSFLAGANGLQPQQTLGQLAKSAMVAHGMALRQHGVVLKGFAWPASQEAAEGRAFAPVADAWHLDSRWRLLVADEQPSWLKGIGELLGGVLLILFAVLKSGSSKGD